MKTFKIKQKVVAFLVSFMVPIVHSRPLEHTPSCKQEPGNTFSRIRNELGTVGCPRGTQVCVQLESYVCELCPNDCYQPDFNTEWDRCKFRKQCDASLYVEYKFRGNVTHNAVCQCRRGFKEVPEEFQRCILDDCAPGQEPDGRGNCVNCRDGYFSMSYDSELCSAATLCEKDHRCTLRNATRTSDTVCGEQHVIDKSFCQSLQKEPKVPNSSLNSSAEQKKRGRNGREAETHDKESVTLTGVLLVCGLYIAVVLIAGVIVCVAAYGKCLNKRETHLKKHIGGEETCEIGAEQVTQGQACQVGRLLGDLWSDLAYLLEFTIPEVENFRSSNQYSVRTQGITMLQNWVRTKKHEATVDCLVQNLEELNIHLQARSVFPEYFREKNLE